MSVEIERLYQENHELKLRIETKDNVNIDKCHLDQQIKELSSQIFDKDQQIKNLSMINTELRRDNT